MKRADILAFVLVAMLIIALSYYVYYLNLMLRNDPCRTCEREKNEVCDPRINPYPPNVISLNVSKLNYTSDNRSYLFWPKP